MNTNSRQKETLSQVFFPRPSIPPLRRTSRRLLAKIPSLGTKFCPQARGVLLHETFLIGNDGPADIGTMLQNADKLLTSCSHADHAAALKKQGWIAKDNTDFATAIAAANPDEPGKAGGTLETVREALSFDVPIAA